MIEIREATKAQASDIARLIMIAMTDDCCLHFCGVGHGLEDFYKMMSSLVEREDSQYSYRNTLVAMADDNVVGIAVSYDGSRLHELRQALLPKCSCSYTVNPRALPMRSSSYKSPPGHALLHRNAGNSHLSWPS